MSTNLNSQAVDVARAAYLAAVRKNEGPSSVVEATIRAYLEAAPIAFVGRPPRKASVSENTIRISKMAVGDVVVLPGDGQATVRHCFVTARRLMNNPDARWSLSTRAKRNEVRRLEDGADGRDPRHNRMAVQIAELAVGESRLFGTHKDQQHTRASFQHAKNQARRILNDPAAEWACKVTTLGLRIARRPSDPVALDLRKMQVPCDIQRIARAVIAKYAVTADQLMAPNREPAVAAARHELVGRVYDLKDRHGDRRYSMADIGRLVGRRDHSTVRNSVRRWEEIKAAGRMAAE